MHVYQVSCACRKNKCLLKFNELQLDPALVRGISDMSHDEPTPIQAAALPTTPPQLLTTRDVVGGRRTGRLGWKRLRGTDGAAQVGG